MKDPSILYESMLFSNKLSNEVPKNIQNIDLILCSQMKRSIQTAILMFPTHFIKNKIKIIPGVNEIGIGHGNKVNKNTKELKNQLCNWIKYIKKDQKLNYHLKNLNDDDIQNLIDSLYSDINIKKNFSFIKSMSENEDVIVKNLVSYLKKKKINKVNIVSHSKFIKHSIIKNNYDLFNDDYLTKKKTLYNNQILSKTYTLNKDKIVDEKYTLLNLGIKFKSKEVTYFNKSQKKTLKINKNKFDYFCKSYK